MATCNGRIDVGRYAIEIKFVHIDRLADAIINQTLYCLSWYNNRLSTAVYNFMQTQKERKPCKIKASAANKRSARRGSNPQSIFNGNAENTGNADKHWSCNNVRNVLYAIKIHYLHRFCNAMHHECNMKCNMKCNMDDYVAIRCSSINFINSF